jgi:hypothetical protein
MASPCASKLDRSCRALAALSPRSCRTAEARRSKHLIPCFLFLVSTRIVGGGSTLRSKRQVSMTTPGITTDTPSAAGARWPEFLSKRFRNSSGIAPSPCRRDIHTSLSRAHDGCHGAVSFSNSHSQTQQPPEQPLSHICCLSSFSSNRIS